MRIDRDENVFPMVAPGAPLDDIIGAVNVGPISHMLEGFENLPFENAAEANDAAHAAEAAAKDKKAANNEKTDDDSEEEGGR